MSFGQIKIGKPNNTRNANHPFAMIPRRSSILILTIKMCGTTLESISKPNLIFFYQLEYFFIRNSILMTNYNEFLSILHQLRHIFSKQTKRRISHHNIGLFQQLNAFCTTKISIAIKIVNADFFWIRNEISISVAKIL